VKKWVKRALISLLVLFAAIQLYRPARTNPPEDVSRTIFADAEVWSDAPKSLERACVDCHTHRTRWPWYSQVAPASWLVVSDVNEAREHMNLSDWAAYDLPQKSSLLADICKEVKSGAMPLPIYLTLHPEAKLTEAERQEICAWVERARVRLTRPPGIPPKN
jgi:hypothetical protein